MWVMSQSSSNGFLFSNLNRNTSFPAFVMPRRLRSLEWTKPKEKKTLSTPADELVAVSNCFATETVSGWMRSAWDTHQSTGCTPLMTLSANMYFRNGDDCAFKFIKSGTIASCCVAANSIALSASLSVKDCPLKLGCMTLANKWCADSACWMRYPVYKFNYKGAT